MKELQKSFGDIFLGGKTISTDHLFILENLKINFHMDAIEFEVLLYNILYEKHFANHRLYMTDEKYDYNISDYVSHHFDITIGETWTCITCNAKNPKY